MDAKGVDELLLAEKQIQRNLEQESGCQLELEKSLFPENCIQQLDGHLALSGSFMELALFLERIKSLCTRRHQEIGSLPRLRQILNLKFLPESCRFVLEERRQDLIYISGQQNGPNLEIKLGHGKDTGAKSLL